MIIVMFEGDVITKVREDFKTNSSFINPLDLTFLLWKYKKTEYKKSATLSETPIGILKNVICTN